MESHSIHLLDAEVVGKIAAGEVVERPASVVKELVENSLDAGARSIQVEIAGGGCDLIRVVDDGQGIAREELLLAVQRHATSKLRSVAELGRISSLGFRGEALASIGAVAELTITSRTAGADSAYRVRLSAGATEGPVAAARAAGTAVVAGNLFSNVPARRKFLRAPSSEAAQVAQLLTQFALAYPEVAFQLTVDGRRTIAAPGSGDPVDAAVAVLGSEVGRALVRVEGRPLPPAPSPAARSGDEETPNPPASFPEGKGERELVGVSGYATEPAVSRGNRTGIWLFVNRRPVRSRSLTFAVEDGYQTLLQVGRHPVAFINIEVPPWEVDVNVHPAKTEVRLLRERLVYATIRDAVREALVRDSSWAKEVAGATVLQAPGMPLADGTTPRMLDAPMVAIPEVGAEAGGRRLPILRLMGQVAQTYIVAEGEHGLYLIDQHAAHERVLHDRLMKTLGQQTNTQLLLEPVSLELTAAQLETARAAGGTLEELGYLVEPFGERSILVRGVPSELPRGQAVRALDESLQELSEEKPEPDWRERVAVALSCRGAVKAGQTLAPEEMRSLLEALEETDVSQHCSHGRPTAIMLSHSQLEREFGRR